MLPLVSAAEDPTYRATAPLIRRPSHPSDPSAVDIAINKCRTC